MRLRSPVGTVVTADGALADRLLADGWAPTEGYSPPPVPVPVLRDPTPAAATSPADPQVAQVAPVEALTAEQEAARAKLPADGSAPAEYAAKAVWVEFAVRNGVDRASAEAATKAALIAAMSG